MAIIEDELDIREAMTDVLEQEGYEVVAASNGREALDLLHRCGNPRVILLDLMMPVMDGWEFRAEQRNDPKLAAVPVVVVSAFPEEGSAQSLGAVEFIRKPLSLDSLLQAVSRFCGPPESR